MNDARYSKAMIVVAYLSALSLSAMDPVMLFAQEARQSPAEETAARVFLVEQLASVGGTTALKTVAAAAKENDEAMQDVATRLLGKWISADAAPAMCDLAKTLPEGKYKIRALRGYIRIARQLNMTPGGRMTVCRNTLAIAGHSDDKALLFDVFRRYPTPEGLAMAVSLLGDEDLQEPACSTIVSMAGHVAQKAPEQTEKALLQVLELSTDPALKANAEKAIVATRGGVRMKQAEAEFTSLFDGKTLDGWKGDKEFWRAENGEIVGGSLTEMVKQNEFLRTEKEYADFELRLQFKLLGNRTNGGVQVRTQNIPNNNEVSGYQADLGDGWWGCLYDESRRNRVLAGPPASQRAKPIRAGDWNDHRIRCEGRRIQIWINGVQTVDYTETDANIKQTGIIALQTHGRLKMEARYRNIRIKEL